MQQVVTTGAICIYVPLPPLSAPRPPARPPARPHLSPTPHPSLPLTSPRPPARPPPIFPVPSRQLAQPLATVADPIPPYRVPPKSPLVPPKIPPLWIPGTTVSRRRLPPNVFVGDFLAPQPTCNFGCPPVLPPKSPPYKNSENSKQGRKGDLVGR